MRAVLAMAIKDLTLALRDWAGLFFMLGFPVALGVFFGAINGGLGSREARLVLALVDEDQSPRSERFVQAMRDGNVSLTMKKTDRESAVAAVRRGAISGAIIISEGFGESIGQEPDFPVPGRRAGEGACCSGRDALVRGGRGGQCLLPGDADEAVVDPVQGRDPGEEAAGQLHAGKLSGLQPGGQLGDRFVVHVNVL